MEKVQLNITTTAATPQTGDMSTALWVSMYSALANATNLFQTDLLSGADAGAQAQGVIQNKEEQDANDQANEMIKFAGYAWVDTLVTYLTYGVMAAGGLSMLSGLLAKKVAEAGLARIAVEKLGGGCKFLQNILMPLTLQAPTAVMGFPPMANR